MSDELDFDDQPYRDGTQILWGRVLVLLLALALAFWLGTTFGGDSSAQGQLDDQTAEIAKLNAENDALEAELAARTAGAQEPVADASPSPTADDGDQQAAQDGPAEGATPDAQATAPAEAAEPEPRRQEREYVVQSGDSLAAIAQEVYGDPTLWRDIALANDLDEPYSLTVGDTLQIPDEP